MKNKNTIIRIVVLTLILALGLTMLSGCGDPEKKLIGTWQYIDDESGEVSADRYISFYDGGKIKDEYGIFEDSYGISYEVSDGKILFIYYGNVEETAAFDILGDKLTLELQEKGKTVTFQKEEK